MLGLLAPTDPSWASAVTRELPGLLVDHAHCELKAAHSALAMVGRFGGEAPEIVGPLLELAREETEHVRLVEEKLRERGETLGMPRADQYVRALRGSAAEIGETSLGRAPPLLDRLLVSALVEARSCERFKVLSEHLDDAGLRSFYRELMASEAAHFRLFTRLAEDRFGASGVRARLAALAQREGEIAASLPLGPTVHG